MHEWGIDACYSCSQKCLSAPSGLAPVVFGPRALARRVRCRSFYFDLTLLHKRQDEAGLRFDNLALDTMLISAFLYPDMDDHSLDAIARRLGLDIARRHTALGDAMATAAVFVRLLDMLEARGIATLDGLIRASNMTLEIKSRRAAF